MLSMSATKPVQDVNIVSTTPLVAPAALKAEQPVSPAALETVVESREVVKRILSGEDRRLMVIVGPCSIHDPEAGLEYAGKLRDLAERVKDRLFLVMRVYFEKPRTTVGWKGLINDPHLNDTFDIAAGLRIARKTLLSIADMGLPAATEMLEPITPQYIADLITTASIGARTTESPTHRQMASGLSMPVGYKNGTDGGLPVAINAMCAAQSQHSFLGIDADGKTCIINTRGNPWGHIILRGGHSGPNFNPEQIAEAESLMQAAGLSARMLVDCSHANSSKDYTKQSLCWNSVLEQRIAGNDTLVGMMLESNLKPGKQSLGSDLSSLERGVSITDGCIGWEETESLLLDAHGRLADACAPASV
ncbi:MAG: 3-deoxy-7-phosphoheptulonate synthase [Planctomycetaceae bacterium]|nr:3-deoxy-7-phosphoheptulonate synthase [Planctomycetaceae bacterium]